MYAAFDRLISLAVVLIQNAAGTTSKAFGFSTHEIGTVFLRERIDKVLHHIYSASKTLQGGMKHHVAYQESFAVVSAIRRASTCSSVDAKLTA